MEFKAEGTIFGNTVKSKLINRLGLNNSTGCEVIGSDLTKEQTGIISMQVSKGTGTHQEIELTDVLWSKTDKEVKDTQNINEVVKQLENLKRIVLILKLKEVHLMKR